MALFSAFFNFKIILLSMRMFLKKRRKNTFVFIFILFFLLAIFFIFYMLFYNINKEMLVYAKYEAKSKISSVINKNVVGIEDDKLYFVTRSNNNNLDMVDYNLKLINDYLASTSKNMTNILERELSNYNFKLPIGMALKKPVLANLGPKISFNIESINIIKLDVKTKLKDYGINNAMIEVFLHMEVEAKLVLPLVTDTIKVSQDIPISYKIITSKVPDFLTNYDKY